MILRPYQSECIEAVYNHLRTRDDNPCAVIPTGGGKTPIIATICRDAVHQWQGRICVLAHVKELLEQAVEKLRAVAPDLPVGVYSAGLGSRDTGYACTVAGIQSVYRRAFDLGRFDLILVDEAHLIPDDGDGMYRQFIADAKVVNPNVRIVGLTATPFRLGTGLICGPQNILNHVCYEVGVRELIVGGYLSPLKSRAGGVEIDISGLHIRGGEFVASEVEELMDSDLAVGPAVDSIVRNAQARRSVLVFCAGVKHATHVAELLAQRGQTVGTVFGDTPDAERQQTIDRFKRGEIKFLCNVNVLTTGFDAPGVDCVVLLRPTASTGLYYQMVGRGFRLAPGKADCLVLDFGANIVRHGPVDMLQIKQESRGKGDGEPPGKVCSNCEAIVATAYRQCPECGHEFPPVVKKHAARAANDEILSTPTDEQLEVDSVTYHVHYKRGDENAKPTMKVEYRVGLNRTVREWVCIEHDGFAGDKARSWWKARSLAPFPASTEEAVALAKSGALANTTGIRVIKKAGEKFETVRSHTLGPRPAFDPDELPVPDFESDIKADGTWDIKPEDVPW